MKTVFLVTFLMSSLVWACPNLSGNYNYVVEADGTKVTLAITQSGCQSLSITETFNAPDGQASVNYDITADNVMRKVTTFDGADQYMAAQFTDSTLQYNSISKNSSDGGLVDTVQGTWSLDSSSNIVESDKETDASGNTTQINLTFVRQ